MVRSKRKGFKPGRNFVVTFDTGKQDAVKMYFWNVEWAIKAIEHQMLARGRKGTISQV